MPGMPRPVADERDALTTFLAHQRYVLRLTAHGLTDDQARLSPTVSAFSVGGLIKHVAQTERGWIDMIAQRTRPSDGTDDYLAGFRLEPDETLADAIAFYDEVAAETAAVLATVTDLDQAVPVPPDVPWFPKDVEAWSVRWVLLHVIEETARRARGHRAGIGRRRHRVSADGRCRRMAEHAVDEAVVTRRQSGRGRMNHLHNVGHSSLAVPASVPSVAS